jgi:biotin carboxylase
VAYASDPAAPTAAYVSERLHLPGNSYSAVRQLTNKALFRQFLHANGFNAPSAMSFSTVETARDHIRAFRLPCMVKPVDSSGSKGVSKIESLAELPAAFALAMSFSRAKAVVLEEFVRRSGYQVAGDAFVMHGSLAFCCLAQEHFNAKCNPFVPIGESFPLRCSATTRQRIEIELQRLIDLLGLRMGALNLDIILDDHARIYLMEVGPRNGGNLIPDVIKLHTGVDLVAHTVDAALGMNGVALRPREGSGFFSSYMIHAERNGVYSGMRLSDHVKDEIMSADVWAREGDPVMKFDGSHCTLGTLVLKFRSAREMTDRMDHMPDHVRIDTVAPQ